MKQSKFNNVYRLLDVVNDNNKSHNLTKKIAAQKSCNDKTPKRAVKEDVIKEIASLDLKDNPSLENTRNLFILSYSLCGMPFVDMAYLKPDNIKNGILSYERRKTNEPINFSLPTLASTIIDSAEAYKQYRTALIEYNRNLRSLSALLHGNPHLTSYVARHSWATSARQHGYPASAIGKALGHTNERTTQTYLDAIDNEVIDKMNNKVLECLQNLLP